MSELLWSLLTLLWSLVRLAFYGVVIYGLFTGRLVWLSKYEARKRRQL